MNGLTVMLLLIMGLPEPQNLRQYTFSSKQEKPVTSYDCVLSILPNGDKVNIPVVNGRVPVLYITQGEASDHISMDYTDKSCASFHGEKSFVYGYGGAPSVAGPGLLETLSEIKKQIESVRDINNSGLIGFDQKLDQSVSKIKELEDMSAQNQKELHKAASHASESQRGISDIKVMVSDLRKELNQIKDKLEVKASRDLQEKREVPEPKKDIIEPSLPVLDKVLTPGKK